MTVLALGGASVLAPVGFTLIPDDHEAASVDRDRFDGTVFGRQTGWDSGPEEMEGAPASTTVVVDGTSGPTPAAAPDADGPAAPDLDAISLAGAPGDLGIPALVLEAYRLASDRNATTRPSCQIRWQVLAGVGRVESRHANGGSVTPAGDAAPRILGPVLNGGQFAAIRDTDDGRWDGDTTWDRAVGPMQFIPGTWASFGADGSGDGVTDPNNVFDATLAAGRYLCSGGNDLSTDAGLASALRRYNNSSAYVALVMSWIAAYDAGDARPVPGVGPGEEPEPDPTEDPVPSPSPTQGPGPTPTEKPDPSPGPSDSPDSSPTPTPSGDPEPTPSSSPTEGPGPSPSPSPTESPSPSPSPTPSPSESPSESPTPSPSPSESPSESPSPNPDPDESPTPTPTPTPTADETEDPTADPDPTPTDSAGPTGTPTPDPTGDESG